MLLYWCSGPGPKVQKKKKPKNGGEEEGDLTTAGAEDANIGVDKGRQTQ